MLIYPVGLDKYATEFGMSYHVVIGYQKYDAGIGSFFSHFINYDLLNKCEFDNLSHLRSLLAW